MALGSFIPHNTLDWIVYSGSQWLSWFSDIHSHGNFFRKFSFLIKIWFGFYRLIFQNDKSILSVFWLVKKSLSLQEFSSELPDTNTIMLPLFAGPAGIWFIQQLLLEICKPQANTKWISLCTSSASKNTKIRAHKQGFDAKRLSLRRAYCCLLVYASFRHG